MTKDCCKSKIINYDGKEYVCSLAFTLNLIGDKYKSLILFHLKEGEMRSGELQKSIHGISNRMFTFSIRALERDGLVSRQVYPEVPPKVIYSLTEAGKSIIPIILEWIDGDKILRKRIIYTQLTNN